MLANPNHIVSAADTLWTAVSAVSFILAVPTRILLMPRYLELQRPTSSRVGDVRVRIGRYNAGEAQCG